MQQRKHIQSSMNAANAQRPIYASYIDYFSPDKRLQICKETIVFKAVSCERRKPKTRVFTVYYADATTKHSRVMRKCTHMPANKPIENVACCAVSEISSRLCMILYMKGIFEALTS